MFNFKKSKTNLRNVFRQWKDSLQHDSTHIEKENVFNLVHIAIEINSIITKLLYFSKSDEIYELNMKLNKIIYKIEKYLDLEITKIVMKHEMEITMLHTYIKSCGKHGILFTDKFKENLSTLINSINDDIEHYEKVILAEKKQKLNHYLSLYENVKSTSADITNIRNTLNEIDKIQCERMWKYLFIKREQYLKTYFQRLKRYEKDQYLFQITESHTIHFNLNEFHEFYTKIPLKDIEEKYMKPLGIIPYKIPKEYLNEKGFLRTDKLFLDIFKEKSNKIDNENKISEVEILNYLKTSKDTNVPFNLVSKCNEIKFENEKIENQFYFKNIYIQLSNLEEIIEKLNKLLITRYHEITVYENTEIEKELSDFKIKCNLFPDVLTIYNEKETREIRVLMWLAVNSTIDYLNNCNFIDEEEIKNRLKIVNQFTDKVNNRCSETAKTIKDNIEIKSKTRNIASFIFNYYSSIFGMYSKTTYNFILIQELQKEYNLSESFTSKIEKMRYVVLKRKMLKQFEKLYLEIKDEMDNFNVIEKNKEINYKDKIEKFAEFKSIAVIFKNLNINDFYYMLDTNKELHSIIFKYIGDKNNTNFDNLNIKKIVDIMLAIYSQEISNENLLRQSDI